MRLIDFKCFEDENLCEYQINVSESVRNNPTFQDTCQCDEIRNTGGDSEELLSLIRHLD